jgi:hypothetical protein
MRWERTGEVVHASVCPRKTAFADLRAGIKVRLGRSVAETAVQKCDEDFLADAAAGQGGRLFRHL